MKSDTSRCAPQSLDLSGVVDRMEGELRCLLGPEINLAIGRLSDGGAVMVRARLEDLVDLLRHLALDAHDAMPAGGTVTIRTGCLHGATECAAIVLHELPHAAGEERTGGRVRKGRSLGLSASYETVERAGGHFHVSCRGRETVLTICFPLAA